MRFGLALLVLAACGSNSGIDGGPGDGDGGGFLDDGAPCVNLQCRQVDCPVAGQTTTISGTVYIPNGTLPLYNAIVYVPNADLGPITEGYPSCELGQQTCDRCDDQLSGSPLVRTTTDTAGNFVLEDVPVGTSIPLVIQLGRWRKEVTLDFPVEACVDNPITDTETTSLPSKQSEGHIPKMALTTGGADAMECLLLKIGLEQEEFTPTSGTGRVNFYNGVGGTSQYAAAWNGGAAFTAVQPWWDSLTNLAAYDIILHSCEGTENPTNKSMAARQAIQDYANCGGRVFGSHWHNFWVENGIDPWPTVAEFNHRADLNSITSDIDTSHTGGQAMADWLFRVGGSTTMGKLDIDDAQHTIDSVNAATGALRWIYLDNGTGGNPSVQYMSFETPLGAEPDEICGKAVISDIHLSAPSQPGSDQPGANYPNGCVSASLSPQEMALIFMLFDISACVGEPIG
jgi:hypothetical protein